MYKETKITRSQANNLLGRGDWLCVGENTGPGFTYWHEETGELLENAESDSPVLRERIKDQS